jgi:hypothetical protein
MVTFMKKLFAIMVAGLCVLTPAMADKSKSKAADKVAVELNQVRQVDKNCIAYFLLKNSTKADFTSFKVELVTFDSNGLISNRILGNFDKIRAGKTMVKLLPIPDSKCSEIDQVLINDVHDCTNEAKLKIDCLDAIVPSNRSKIKLIK